MILKSMSQTPINHPSVDYDHKQEDSLIDRGFDEVFPIRERRNAMAPSYDFPHQRRSGMHVSYDDAHSLITNQPAPLSRPHMQRTRKTLQFGNPDHETNDTRRVFNTQDELDYSSSRDSIHCPADNQGHRRMAVLPHMNAMLGSSTSSHENIDETPLMLPSPVKHESKFAGRNAHNNLDGVSGRGLGHALKSSNETKDMLVDHAQVFPACSLRRRLVVDLFVSSNAKIELNMVQRLLNQIFLDPSICRTSEHSNIILNPITNLLTTGRHRRALNFIYDDEIIGSPLDLMDAINQMYIPGLQFLMESDNDPVAKKTPRFTVYSDTNNPTNQLPVRRRTGMGIFEPQATCSSQESRRKTSLTNAIYVKSNRIASARDNTESNVNL